MGGLEPQAACKVTQNNQLPRIIDCIRYMEKTCANVSALNHKRTFNQFPQALSTSSIHQIDMNCTYYTVEQQIFFGDIRKFVAKFVRISVYRRIPFSVTRSSLKHPVITHSRRYVSICQAILGQSESASKTEPSVPDLPACHTTGCQVKQRRHVFCQPQPNKQQSKGCR